MAAPMDTHAVPTTALHRAPMAAGVCADTAQEASVAWLREHLPRPMVFTNGVFDLLHAGHVACLEAARAQGASLVVGVNSDASARHLRKGPGRPINTAADRARVLAALASVTAVLVFDEDKPLALICALRPDVYVKGGDYTIDRLAEAALMQEWGGRTQIVPRLPSLSTTALVERLRRPWQGLAPRPGSTAWIEP